MYRTNPLVWGGDPACQHEWAMEVRKDTRGGNGSTLDGDNGQEASRFDMEWGTCRRCGAWRGNLGLEAIPDCHAWARGEPPCPACYVCHMRTIFAEVRRVMRRDAVLWLNLGDSYTSGGRPYRDPGKSKIHTPLRGLERPDTPPGLKPKDLVGVPWRVALALQADGFYLRNDDIWEKANCMPDSTTDRCTRNHEYIFQMSVSERYFYDAFAIREPAVSDASGNKERKVSAADGRGSLKMHMGSSVPWTNDGNGRNRRTVWRMSTTAFSIENCSACGRSYDRPDYTTLPDGPAGQGRVCRCGASGSWVSHFAVFPEELPLTSILAGTSERGCCAACGAQWRRVTETPAVEMGGYAGKWSREGAQSSGRRILGRLQAAREAGQPHDAPFPEPRTTGWEPGCKCKDSGAQPSVVLDPFSGGGTTALVALKSNRRFVGLELNHDYIRISEHRVAPEIAQPRLL
jgi:DNA modification methylase